MMQLFQFILYVFFMLGLCSWFHYGGAENISEHTNNYNERTDNYNERYSCMCNNNHSESREYANYHFVSAIEKLRCCHGSARCKFIGKPATSQLMGKAVSSIQNTETCNSMLCFSDVTCLANAKTCALTQLSSCAKQSANCSTIFHQRMNISNNFGEYSNYKCFWMTYLNSSVCLLPECTDFAVIERKCDCQMNKSRCTCQSSDDDKLPTYALFFSFKDVFITLPKPYFSTYSLLIILLSVLAVLGMLIIVMKFHKPIKAFTYGRILRFLCCGKTSPNVAVLHASSANSNGKVENFVTPAGDGENSNTVLPTYDEAMKTVKMLNVEPPPKYCEAVI